MIRTKLTSLAISALAGLIFAAAVPLSALAQTAGVDFLTAGGGPGGGESPAGSAACAGGEIHDDGVPENGYGWNPATISDGRFGEVFSPATEFVYTEVCICWTQTGGDTTIDYEVAVWDDDGADGSPGTLLGSVPAQATGVPGALPGQFYSVDISSLNLAVSPGDNVYIGARWDPMTEQQFFICADESEATPLNGGHAFNDVDGAWMPTQNYASFASYRALLVRGNGFEGTPGQTTFLVSKNFNDNNTAEVEVTLSCNTGLPLEQTTTISEGDPVNFVIGDFEDGTLDCEVTEVVPDGYTASYFDGTSSSDVSCTYEDIDGTFSPSNECEITNSLNEVEVEVTKEWIDENPQFNAQNVASATWSCSNVAFPCELGFANGCDGGILDFFGNPGEDSFFVFPDWESGTTCSITEVDLLESGIEVDDSDCQGLLLLPGEGASCTIVNTRLFEGIPTLSQYGLALLALLMLGMGFVAFRRVI